MSKFLAALAVSLFAVSSFAQASVPITPVVSQHAAPHHAKKKVLHKKAKAHKKHLVKAKHVPMQMKHKHQG